MRIKLVVAAVMAGVGVLGVLPAMASPSPTLPPVCVREPVPNPLIPDAQVQVGYCP